MNATMLAKARILRTSARVYAEAKPATLLAHTIYMHNTGVWPAALGKPEAPTTADWIRAAEHLELRAAEA